MQPAPVERIAGFTLVEMLIAMVLFGIMSTVAYRVLDTALVTRERVGDEYRRWRDVARALTWMERDLAAIQARPVRDASDSVAAPLVGVPIVTRADEAAITFTRSGDPDERGGAIAPRRVGYRVQNGALELLTWTVLDQAPRSTPTVSVVLQEVAGLGVRYRDAAGAWHAAWPRNADRASGSGRTTLPAGVELTVQLTTGERITRLIPLFTGAQP